MDGYLKCLNSVQTTFGSTQIKIQYGKWILEIELKNLEQ